ncbi:DNA polymerase III subunit gamma/tau [Bauldia sp.]|uniref:DNA polymerase III subunit gamma/tau n=1 Tax=Bauldia sp. TaxID=2575872 RepID=UPI003BAA0510
MDGSTQDIAETGHYRVLARKYRPSSFADLIGQEPMVRTLTNAFDTGRIAQAYMLTGVRGVGKTTTARILARALNYLVPGEIDKPTIAMDRPGEHCAAIMEGRHIDVIEMDAASHTGIDDIREIIEASRYKPAVARYKVYIIDEVHMLSKAAFNGLLKTLEEPPEHVKFVFATTEIRKVPVTVLSRCQRFDLRRIEADRLIGLMRDIAGKEGIAVDDEALVMLARAAEGSARDSLSLLDQAIAHASGQVEAEAVRTMLGLADKALVIDLFGDLMKGAVAEALERLKALYDVGADPAVVLEDLAAFTHIVTRLKLAPDAAADGGLTEEERTRGTEFAQALSLRILARTWQMLLKGIDEARQSNRPLAAADMVLVRIAHAADLPTPDEALRALRDGGGAATTRAPRVAGSSAPASGPPAARLAAVAGGGASTPPEPKVTPAATQPRPASEPLTRLDSFEDLVALAGTKRDLKWKHALEHQVRVIHFEDGRVDLAPTADAPASLPGDLSRQLEHWTGRRWMVAVAREAAAPTVAEARQAARDRLVDDAKADPAVAAVLAAFPGAEVVDVRVRGDVADDDGVEPPIEDAGELDP